MDQDNLEETNKESELEPEAPAVTDEATAAEPEADYKDKYLRALADYQNLAKKTASEKQEYYKFVLEDFLQELLPVYDHLKLSVSNLNETESQSPWVAGVQYVLKQFKDLLFGRGIEEIEALGKPFDPRTMEAMAGGGETVKRELRPGYMLNGKVIIPAKVEVE
jgi:molecular chaperone GrpE